MTWRSLTATTANIGCVLTACSKTMIQKIMIQKTMIPMSDTEEEFDTEGEAGFRAGAFGVLLFVWSLL
jgi:hypothetical protein